MNILMTEIIGSESNNDEYEIITPTTEMAEEFFIFRNKVNAEYDAMYQEETNDKSYTVNTASDYIFWLTKKPNYIKVVMKHRKIYGYIACKFRDEEYGLLGIMLLNKITGKGYGTRLITDLISYAKSINSKRIRLFVHKRNTGAITLYEKFGFKTVKINTNYIKMVLYL